MPDPGATPYRAASIESRASWTAAWLTLVIVSISYGSPLLVVVGLKPIQEALGTDRSVVALAGALVWAGAGLGGIMMGWLADRIGIRLTASIGAVMMAAGLAISASGSVWALYVGHGLLIGLLGIGAMYAPLVVYVSRWFDRRRGSALALISSGAYLAGAIWPPIFARAIAYAGWRHTMLYYAAFELLIIAPAAAIFLEQPPAVPHHTLHAAAAHKQKSVMGWPPNLVFGLQMCAIFTCCIPMSMPQGHLVAFCTDHGISAAHGAAMVSVLLGAAFFSRQVWGAISDRIGVFIRCSPARPARHLVCSRFS